MLLVDVVAYAVVFATLVVVAVTPVGYVAGDGWTGVKVGLFLVGMAFFGYSSIWLWLQSSQQKYDEKRDSRSTVSREQESRLQTALDDRSIYPTDSIPPAVRISPGTKLFVGSLIVLAVSFVMETRFGV
ncbi:hypothetical protein C490_08711 [Natronobacterium gregoryi SP2]|uniref:Uncharacterized protein n=1 Tax=Natronobacterium gregoryi (strain ATCC 43098 / DSM 3393 / CCM 3738 / CIP 104747 / IAM 13177 / JCM 8860 / NBRC 102187 / NCIMB 2189 / SP2) TaxID=797304 RepID=L9Y4R7_NATGS|nr:hypothetical protein C490_08711 [Natronobacterium gregoryi SP2]